MITAYVGPPGSGKSLDMCRRIEQAIRQWRNVICNSEITLPDKLKHRSDKLFCVENEEITPDFLYDFADKHHRPDRESQTLVVIDECQLKFSQTFLTKGTVQPWLTFFSQHRKKGYDFLMVTPDIRTGLIRDIRVIVELEVTHWKMTNFPTKSIVAGLILLTIHLLPVELFMSVMQWRAMPDKRFLTRRLFWYKPKYSKMYNTFKIYDVTPTKQSGNRSSQGDKEDPARDPDDISELLANLLSPPGGLSWERGGGDTAGGRDPPRSQWEPDSAV